MTTTIKEFYGAHKNLILPAIIFLAVFLLFSRILLNDFVYDDLTLVVSNRNIIGNVINPVYYFTHGDALRPYDPANLDIYRPLSVWFLSLEHWIFGMDSFYFHLINLLLHSTNAVLFYLLLKKFLPGNLMPFFGALLFGIHPITTETTAWINQQTALWSWFFSFLTLWIGLSRIGEQTVRKLPNFNPLSFQRKLESSIQEVFHRTGFRIKCGMTVFGRSVCKIFVLFALSFAAVFSKEQAVILPLIYLFCLFWKVVAAKAATTGFEEERSDGLSADLSAKALASAEASAKAEKIPDVEEKRRKKFGWKGLGAITFAVVLYLLFRAVFLGSFVQQEPWGGGRYSIFLTMINGFVYYLKLLVWPYPLSINYDSFPIARSITDSHVIFSALILILIVSAAIILMRRLPLFSLGIFWIFTVLLPVSNFILPTKQIINERFLYFALPGFIIAILGIAGRYIPTPNFEKSNLGQTKHSHILENMRMFLGGRLNNIYYAIFTIFTIIILAVFAIFTYTRLGDWQNELMLWKHELKVSANSWRTQKNYAWALEMENLTKESILHYKLSLELAHNPDLALKSVNALAIAYIRVDEPQKATELISEALKDFPEQGALFYTLGQAYLNAKQYGNAEKIFSNLSEKNNGEDTALFFAILASGLSGKKDEKIKGEIGKIKNPRFREQTLLLIQGREKMLEEKWTEAIPLFINALRISRPPILEPYLWLAESFEKSGQKEKALAVYDLTLSLHPLSIDAMQGIKKLEQ